MTFRKDSLLFYEGQIIYAIMSILCLLLPPALGWSVSLLLLSIFIVLLLISPKLHNQYITIDATGIVCQQSGKQLWVYNWEQVAELRKSSRFQLPSIEIIAYNKVGVPEQFAHPNHYFQLGRTARKAITRHYKKGKTEDGFREP